jgi:hypothetical protein
MPGIVGKVTLSASSLDAGKAIDAPVAGDGAGFHDSFAATAADDGGENLGFGGEFALKINL